MKRNKKYFSLLLIAVMVLNLFSVLAIPVNAATTQTTYSIHYNANGGTGIPESQIKIKNEVLVLSPTTPTRAGYNFMGWATSANATKGTYTPGQSYKTNANKLLYAAWEAKKFTVEYDVNMDDDSDGKVTNKPKDQTKIRDTALTLKGAPAKKGYKFLGWSTDDKAIKAKYASSGKYTANKSITLYGVWEDLEDVEKNTYRIWYNVNSGSGIPNAQTKQKNKTIKLRTKKPTRTGYVFKGWSTSKTATNATYAPGGSYKTNANKLLYAVWVPNSYTVKYNKNGGSGTITSHTKTYGKTLTLKATKPKRDGCTFIGWSTDSVATTATYAASGKYTANSQITLYAVWKGNPGTYIVNYDANGGTDAPISQVKTSDVSLTLRSSKPTRTGYVFKGWSTSNTGTKVTHAVSATYTDNNDLLLYAVWRKKLATPKNLVLTETKVTWNKVANNSGYTLKILQGSTLIKTVQIEQDVKNYKIPANTFVKGKKYKVKLIAKGTGAYANSAAAVSATITIN